jgi:hypothetical protein
MLVRLIAVVLAVAAVPVVSACGGEHEPKREAVGNPADPFGTEGAYLELEPMSYQVQISRQLNPRNIEDRAYLQGVAPRLKALTPEQTWFGIFIRVVNEGEETALTANRFRVLDTEGDAFRPIPISPASEWAYKAIPLPPKGIIPNPDSVAGQGVINGRMLLFKMEYATLQNRPLVLEIVDPRGRKARVNLDV